MNYLITLILQSDPCPLVFVILILFVVGRAMIEGHPILQLWGLRIAILAFLAFTVLRSIEIGLPRRINPLLSTLFMGLAVGALVLGPAWIVLAILGFFYGYYQKFRDAAQFRAQRRRNERELRRKKEEERQRQEASRPTPEQLEAEQRAAERRRQEASQAAEAAKRREDAIAACELLYHLRAPDIGERFTRKQLDEFVTKYMAANKPIDDVERWAGELQRLIQQHYEAVKPPTKFNDLGQLTAWVEEQTQQIRSLPIADVYKKDFLVQLNERYAELTQQMMEKMS